jgi:hypothetical protein
MRLARGRPPRWRGAGRHRIALLIWQFWRFMK